jgi:hypothetical protein
MSLIPTFGLQINAGYLDLLKYSKSNINILAEHLQIPLYHDHKKTCLEISRKLINQHNIDPNGPQCNKFLDSMENINLDNIHKRLQIEFSKFKDTVYIMTPSDLEKLFNRYDDLCFKGQIKDYFNQHNFTITFKTTGEPTFTTEGLCGPKTCHYVMTILTDPFKNIFKPTNVAGHICNNQLQCLMRVIEHELVHLLVFIFCGDPFMTDQHGDLFITLSQQLFNHTDIHHYIF